MKRFLLFPIVSFAIVASAPASSLYFINDTTNTLNIFDTVALTSSLVGATGISTSFGDMAWDRTTGTMYAIGGRGNASLYTINLATGAATLVGNHGITDLFALGVDAAGNLYAQGTPQANPNVNVFTLSKVTGAASNVGLNNVYPGGYTFNTTTGQMIYAEAGGGGIYDVNLATGAANFLAATGSINDNDIAYDASMNDYWSLDYNGQASRYDSLFNRTLMQTGLGGIAAADFATPVPEPGTMAVIGLGLVALIKKRRAKAS
ncbi:MAG: PEP-CTERM sorting domain-containing protein [Chlorobia bacterium]|nr:PEP-CTERM sorting domain-containing protein [Fimbriimonadaceae bacterium]